MNWQAISFDWNQIRAFLATAEEGSFSGAARVLKTTQPTIGRQISALEDTLGVTLVERSVRGLTLTEAGRDLMDHVRAMGEAATLISMSADRQSQDISGDVTITATDLFGVTIMPEILLRLRETAPGIRIRIVASSEIQNLMQRDADIAVRHVRPDQPELIARHVGDFRASLHAATAYLDRAGRPSTPRDLTEHAFISDLDTGTMLATLHNHGLPFQAENCFFASDSGAVVWEMFKAGYGMALVPGAMCDITPGIEKVFPDLPSIDFPVWLVTHRELRTNRRIRVVFDLLARELKDKLQVS
ncbi:Transcriptional regulator, LysR family [Candidatus Phaeomarinobacter ectocarpi]|uniref:Transcriptional regulator, LysR family n=1 Tax=Candidatus Phaeomarinibacter ectocarpi TaxID=1458461 RepID=X5M951_9HYPH|nr:LysR family transcriptional regulator [Candidatus Phaeomarinobacter ectocarpi]CDO59978.1 Transcriptional regulator, LysR family [Candidatus Phaeomarinobacter ectocarpi]